MAAKIRQEINILDHALVSTTTTVSSNEKVQWDGLQFNGTKTLYFEIIATNTSASARNVNLRILGAIATISVTAGTTTPTLFRSSSFTRNDNTDEYYVDAEGLASGTLTIKAARVVIIQEATTLTNTETQIEIGNYNTGRTAETATILTNPKYWKYDASKWDGTKTFYVEAVYDSGDMDTISVYLYECTDITAPSWTLNATIVNAATTTVPTRTRVAFTPVDGRWYTIFSLNGSMDNHDIYRAGIVVDQGITDFYETNNASTIIQGGTGTSSQTNQAKGQSFTTTSAYSINGVQILAGIGFGSPTDNLYIELLSGSINGTIIGTTASVSGTSLSSTLAWTNFLFDSPIALSNATKYYLRILRDGPRDAANYFKIGADGSGSSTYAGGGFYARDNNVWGAESTTVDNNFRTLVVPTKLEPQYLLANTLFAAGTSLQTFLTDWDSTEWDDGAGSITYYFQAEAANGSTSDVTLEEADGGGTVTNSTLTNIDNAQISAAMTMPADQNLDTKATTNAGDVAAARILVAYVFSAAPPAAPYTPTVTRTTRNIIGPGIKRIVILFLASIYHFFK